MKCSCDSIVGEASTLRIKIMFPDAQFSWLRFYSSPETPNLPSRRNRRVIFIPIEWLLWSLLFWILSCPLRFQKNRRVHRVWYISPQISDKTSSKLSAVINNITPSRSVGNLPIGSKFKSLAKKRYFADQVWFKRTAWSTNRFKSILS